MTKRSEQQWRELIDRHRESGLTLKAFCKREGLSRDWFGRKRQRLLKGSGERTAPAAGFARMRVVKAVEPIEPIELRYGAVVCRLPVQLPAAYLAALIKAL